MAALYTSTEGGTKNSTKRQRLLQQWSQLSTERSSWIGHWRELGEQFMPRAARFYASDRNRGDKRHNNIINNTGLRARKILSAGMMSGATSPARPWFRLTHPDPELMEFAPVKEWMADVQRLMLTVFARSNTYNMLHQSYDELGVFGTHAVIMYDDFDKVIYNYNSPTGEFALDQDYRGNVNVLARNFEKTVAQLVMEFGLQNCSTTVKNLWDNSNYNAPIPVLHVIQPRAEAERDFSKRDRLNMAYSSCYMELGREDIGDKFLRESGFRNFPVLAPRWGKTGGDVYGESPGMDALGDSRSLQHKELRGANAIDYQTKPPIQLPTSARGQEKNFLPGGVAYFDSPDNRNAARSLWDVSLNMQHLTESKMADEQRINSAFFADLFLMLSNADKTNMTATEVAEKHEEKLVQLGPVLERLHNEELEPLVENTFARMVEVGMVPEPPAELKGQELNVQFVSILAQAQRAIGVNSVDRFVANLGVIANFKPDVVDKFDSDRWADRYADMMGVDPDLIVPGDKVALIRKQRAKAQEGMQRAAQAAEEAKAAQALGSVKTNEPNLATDIMQQFSGYSAPGGTGV